MIFTENVSKWIEKSIEENKAEYIEWEWENNQIEEALKRDRAYLNSLAEKMYSLVNDKVEEELIKLYSFFENLSNNRKIAFLFREYTGVPTGTTNKEGVAAFNKYFGIEIENKIKAQKQAIKDEEARKIEEEKQAKENEIKNYFKNPLWNIEGLNNIQLGRIKKSLEKQYRYTSLNKILTVKEYIENHLECISKYCTNNMYKYNRKKFNSMDGYEQREYNRKLLEGRTFFIDLADNYSYEIPKIVFDILNLEDTTDQEKLAS